jgi:hypothetical protein
MSRTHKTLLRFMRIPVAFPAWFAAQKKDKEVIWQYPGDLSSLNLLYGAGGKAHASDPTSALPSSKQTWKPVQAPGDLEMYTQPMQKRIAELAAL